MTRRLGFSLAFLLALVLLVPTSMTYAYFTAEASAEQTTGDIGRWCAVPTPEKQSNVYRLSDMPTYDSSSSSLAIVPVVNNGEFGPAGGPRTLGVRLWACNAASLTSDSGVKVTAWRNEGSNAENKIWLPRQGDDFAGHRLDPSQGFGADLLGQHRFGSGIDKLPHIRASLRSHYSWLVASGRTKDDRSASDTCLTTVLCVININPTPSFANAFKADSGTSPTPKNSVEYLAAGFWAGDGTFSPGDPKTVRLDQYSGSDPPFSNGQGPASTSGKQVQWVIMEWWGDTKPSEDMVIEVFLE